MALTGNAVFATLLMNDGYLPGAMVLGHSLKDKGAKGKLVAFVTVDKLASNTITELKTVYDEVVPVQHIMNKTPANLYLMDRPDLIGTFTKIELWRQTQYKRIVYLDADMVALRAPNELLTIDTNFAAVPDIGWPDCFNSGMMVLNPNIADYYALLALAERGISFDGADQGLLNMHFTQWERLSFTYNCTPSGNYQYLPAYRHFQSSISMVHFIGKEKPWTTGRSNSNSSGVYSELLGRWWAVYDRHYRAQEVVYYSGGYQDSPKRVQDFVAGEETIYLPSSQAPPSQSSSASSSQAPPSQQSSTGQSLPPPTIIVSSSSSTEQPTQFTMEQPMGDRPDVQERIQKEEYIPTPTVEQRRFSAPHAEWEPARAPPPVNSKPEASNFPTQTYEMSASRELFRPPASYPEAPKDMWYQVPQKPPPSPKPKPIFPWEGRAPKPTRVFAEPKLPSPPPEPEVSPEPEIAEEETALPSGTIGSADTAIDTIETPKEPYVDPWTTFNQRTNAWDDMPEIAKYMQSLSGAKKGKIQVLHHTPSSSTPSGDLRSPPVTGGRRNSVKVTDFPTEQERPSLPVTPAPIRRPTFWGEERDEIGELPGAEGVPKQAEWNPIIKLDELQRRQSEALLNKEVGAIRTPPKRDLPESQSKEAVVQAAEKAMIPPAKAPLKPILKEPKFGIPGKDPTIPEVETKNEDDEELDPVAPA